MAAGIADQTCFGSARLKPGAAKTLLILQKLMFPAYLTKLDSQTLLT
jgi:hypothetical protein